MRKAAMAYPEAREDHPWGESAFKVRGKTFLFMSQWEGRLNFTFKLPRSFEFALEYPFATPAGYGLARARWIYARFEPASDPPLDVLTAWLDESFRAVAPKRLSATLDAAAPD
ncbi:MAG: MmcQ/YjbR family DNA-binding protein [Bauldia sp.]|nr:MmcQ/YjbR family DNA-binding protein [Bauldia sp.]